MKTKLVLLLIGSFFSFSALAHVTMEPKEAPAASYAKLVFRVPHGCDGSPTVKITVQIPDGVLSVKPQVHAAWQITLKKKKDIVTEVSWSGELSDEYMDEFGMSVKLPDGEGNHLSFPVTQECKKGSAEWKPSLMLTKPSAMHSMEH